MHHNEQPPSIITIHRVARPYGWLSNMAPYAIEHLGYTWRTAEALFQALRFDDEPIREAIRAERSPLAAKHLAYRHLDAMIVQPRTELDVENMRTVLRLKLAAHPQLQTELIATGDAQIIEDCSNRPTESGLFWGAALRGGLWSGQNVLGKLWMELREAKRMGNLS
jgi:hypothetical protein